MRRKFFGLVVASVLLTSGLAAAIPVVSAGAAGTNLLTETFTDATTASAGWQMPTGSSGVCLTAGTNTSATPIPDCNTTNDANGSGALQLTNNASAQVGTIYNSVALPTSNGLDITWDSYQFNGTGADGISFDLASVNPSDPVPPSTVGPSGGSLGYSTTSGGSTPGVPFGYLGFGADVYGNFENGTFGGADCNQSSPAIPESMGVRGPGNDLSGYCLLAQANLAGGITFDSKAATARAGLAVPEEVVINPSGSAVTASSTGLSVPSGDWMFATEPLVSGAAGTVWHFLEGTLPTNPVGVPGGWLNSSGLPKELAFGWASSTGGSNEFHQINFLVAQSLTTAPTLALTNTDSGSLTVGTTGTVTLTASVPSSSAVSENTAPVVSDTFPASLTPTIASGTNWGCSTSGQLVSCTYLGTGPIAANTTLPPISVSVTPNAGGAFANSASVSSADAAPETVVDNGTVALASQSISFTNTPPTNPLPGSTYTAAATGGASGNPVTFSVDHTSTSGCTVNASTGLVTLTPPAGTCVIDANQAGSAGYTAAAQVQQTVTSVLGAQAISFTNTPPTNPLPGSTYTAAATGGASGNPVTFSVDHTSTSGCTVNASTGLVTLTLPTGTCVVDANQAGSTAYAAAAQVQQTTNSIPGTQTINFTNTPPPSPLVGTIYTVAATGGASGNPVTFSVDHTSTSGCTVNSSTGLVTVSSPAGTCVIDANQAGNGVYAAATQVQQSVTSRSLSGQSITFTNTPPVNPIIGTAYTVTATGGASGNPVTFSVDPSSTSGCTVNSSTGLVTLTAPAGTCVIDANQVGSSNFGAAAKVSQSVTSVVPPGDPTATITSPASGRTFIIGQKVTTSFVCADPNGPGVATCSDGRSTSGKGLLATSSTGDFTYVVTATSKSGQTTTARIRYKVVPRSISLTIYFANNSWVLTASATGQLNGFANAVAQDGFSSVSIDGYASSTGSFPANHKLGVRRARAAWTYLESRLASLSANGVAANLHGLGATRFMVSPSSAAANRRSVLTAR